MAVLTLGLLLLLGFMRLAEGRILQRVAPFVFLAALTVVHYLGVGPHVDPVKDLQPVVTLALLASAVWAGSDFARNSLTSCSVLVKATRRAALVLASLFALQVAAQVDLVGNRTAAAAAGVLFAVLLPYCFAASPTPNSPERFAAVLLIAVVVASQSRTASVALAVVAMVYVYLRHAASRRWTRPVGALRSALLSAILLVMGTVAVWLIPTLRARFLQRGDAGLQIGNVVINTHGRRQWWEILSEDLEAGGFRSLIGWGSGSAGRRISGISAGVSEHPHNDYLRLVYDLGLGLGLAWVIVLFVAMLWAWRNCTRKQLARSSWDATPSQAAVLSSVFALIVMLTDNVLAYWFVVVPWGIWLGVGLARPAPSAPPRDVTSLAHH